MRPWLALASLLVATAVAAQQPLPPEGEAPAAGRAAPEIEADEPDDAAAPPDQAAAEAADARLLNPLAALDKATLQGFREMPLFTPSRKRPSPPPPPEEPEEEPAAPEPKEAEPAPAPELKLAGVVEGPEGAIAVVQDVNAGKVERLRLGDQIGGWLVTGIEGATLKLTLDDREEEYKLFQRSDPAKAGSEKSDESESEDPEL